jgi:hypothetical protein
MKNFPFFQIIANVCLTIFIVSCSSEPINEHRPKQYSDSTQRQFEAIEKNDYQINPPSVPQPKPLPKVVSPSKEVTPEKPKEVILDSFELSQLSAKNQERLQEINQNLAFYCMKHRKDRIFKDEEECLAFTKNVLKSCEKKHRLINTVMVNCIKEKLKKRQ